MSDDTPHNPQCQPDGAAPAVGPAVSSTAPDLSLPSHVEIVVHRWVDDEEEDDAASASAGLHSYVHRVPVVGHLSSSSAANLTTHAGGGSSSASSSLHGGSPPIMHSPSVDAACERPCSLPSEFHRNSSPLRPRELAHSRLEKASSDSSSPLQPPTALTSGPQSSSLLTRALHAHAEEAEARGRQKYPAVTHVVNLRPLEETLPSMELFSDITDRGMRSNPPHAWDHRQSNEDRVRGQASAHWLISHDSPPQVPKGLAGGVRSVLSAASSLDTLGVHLDLPLFNAAGSCLATGLSTLPLVFSILGVVPAVLALLTMCLGSHFTALVIVRHSQLGSSSQIGASPGPGRRAAEGAASAMVAWIFSVFALHTLSLLFLAEDGGVIPEILPYGAPRPWYLAPCAVDLLEVVATLALMVGMDWMRFAFYSVALSAAAAAFVLCLTTTASVGLLTGRALGPNLFPCPLSSRFPPAEAHS